MHHSSLNSYILFISDKLNSSWSWYNTKTVGCDTKVKLAVISRKVWDWLS
jgi:hypothetical protein